MPYYVNRVNDYYSGRSVEITVDRDEGSPGRLANPYDGEGEYDSPVEAVEAAIKVRAAWEAYCKHNGLCDTQGVSPNGSRVGISYGTDGGGLVSLENNEPSDETYAAVRAWAARELESMKVCPQCGERFNHTGFTVFESGFDDEEFCCESCAERAMQDSQENDDDEQARLDAEYEADSDD